MAYFLAFGIFVPLVSYLIVYGLYLLRVYIFEYVAIEAATKEQFKASAGTYEKVKTRMRAKTALPPPPTPPPPTIKQSPSATASSTGRNQRDVLNFEIDSDTSASRVQLRKSNFSRERRVRPIT